MSPTLLRMKGKRRRRLDEGDWGVGVLFILSELIFIVVEMQPTGVEMNLNSKSVGKFVCVCKYGVRRPFRCIGSIETSVVVRCLRQNESD